MLTLTRKNDQSIIIRPTSGLDPNMTVAELFEQSNIQIRFNKIRHGVASVSIKAPKSLDLMREEILNDVQKN